MKNNNQEVESLVDSFNWENTKEDDFFNINPVEPEKEEEPAEEEEEEVEEKPKPSKAKKKEEDPKEEEEEEDFGDFQPEEEENPEDPKSSTEVKSIYTDLYKDLKETGVFKHVDLEEEESDIDEDRFLELQEQEYEAEMNERIIAWAGTMDEDAKAFIKFKKDGGSTAEFFETYKGVSGLPEGDIDDEDYQDDLIRYQLSEEGWDAEEIEDRLEYLTKNNTKERTARKYDVKVRQEVENKKKAVEIRNKEARIKALQDEEDFKSDIKETLDKTNEISGFKITPKDKQKVLNFLTKKEHKISGDKSITGFQKKLAETFQSTEKMILLAKLVESDFDLSGFEKKVITKKTQDIKSNLSQRKSRPTSSGSSLGGVNLADLFN